MSLSHSITFSTGRTLNVPTGIFIDNKFVKSDSGKTFSTIDPVTEKSICEVQLASEQDVNNAVISSRRAFTSTWGVHSTPSARGKLLMRLADLVERDAQSLAELESLDNGKPVSFARDVDVTDSIACLRYYAGWTDKIVGETIPVDDPTKFAFTRHEPVGVCAAIIPWNYPLMMLAWKTAPALAAGCTVIMKPSELTPLTALKFCELIAEAGFPPGVFNCVPSTGPIGGAALSSHLDVDKIAFTGSTATGRKIMVAAAQSNLKKVTLELGGKSPHLIFASADLEKAAQTAVDGIMPNMGQDCVAGSRVYVQSDIYDAFVEKVVGIIEDLTKKVGDPFVDGTEGGPLVSEGQRDKVWGYIESGISEGAKVLIGARKWDGKGYYILPTAFGNVKPHMKVVREEIFGPVVVIGKFDTEDEAVTLANDTTYGLGAGIQSNDHKQILRVSAALKAGTVWINQYGTLHNNVPFGGFKQSGIGRELGSYALQEYMSIKAVHWDYS